MHLRSKYKFICATNAFNYTVDKNNNETYGITSLMNFFQKNTNYALIISDPSGAYYQKTKNITENILIINKPHSFIQVLQFVNCYIRYTTTDGDSLSIHEALDNNVHTIATDVVDRPDDVICVKKDDFNQLKNVLISLQKNDTQKKKEKTGNNSKVPILTFYKTVVYNLIIEN
jgi:predicted RNA-binding protein YlqC (UPF0109 family)